MNATRCKMELIMISKGYGSSGKERYVKFIPVSGGSEENKKFFSATPSGSLDFTVSGAAAESLGLDQAAIGAEFYVDIKPANKAD